ncbi:MAG TPA: chemotaxis protein CheX [Blastocatellia bacterium]|nr:chemotaxis protein CheX [Blastocatellia bacterium]
MRLDFVKIFIDSTTQIFGEVVGPRADVNSIAMKANPVAGREVMTIIGLAGEAQGRVIFDMSQDTAVQLAGCMLGDRSPGMTPLVRSSVAELASMAIGRAISAVNDRGTKLRMSPPTVITGANLDSFDQCFETLVAPINTAYGEVRMNITIQDLE